eukprot:GEMP01019240.1.p1 GENE.GEMP01019240.1~~GEMP01019240.1.p1  ORF type:complete len:461 (+),score=142.04 GEMP01019240.1:103-1485(+)
MEAFTRSTGEATGPSACQNCQEEEDAKRQEEKRHDDTVADWPECIVTFLNGDSMVVKMCSTIVDLKVDTAAYLNTYFPYIIALDADTGTVLEDDADIPRPPARVNVIAANSDNFNGFNRSQWEHVIVHHAVRGDHIGAKRGLSAARALFADKAVRDTLDNLLSDCIDNFHYGARRYSDAIASVWHSMSPELLRHPSYMDTVVSSLIRASADMDFYSHDGEPFIAWAAQNKLSATVEACIQSTLNAHFPVRYGTVFHTLLADNTYSAVRDVLSALILCQQRVEANANAYGGTPLTLAIAHNDSVTARDLLAAQADVSREDCSWRTPLTVAVQQHIRHHGIDTNGTVEMVLAARADVNAADSRTGITALMSAVMYNDKALVRVLLEHNADVNVRTPRGLAPLMLAVEHKKVDLVQMFLSANADADVHVTKTLASRTALFDAVKQGNTVMVDSLLSATADSRH